jgi:hypothetical protein
MAYTIKNTDGTTLVLLADGRIDSNSTSITLVGKNYAGYGEIWNNNLIKLMGNFARSQAPVNPIIGQLWYDTENGKLNVFDEDFKPINGATVSAFEPENLNEGEFWYDSADEQLKIKTLSGTQVIGPAFPATAQSGWILPPNAIRDTNNNVQQVVLLRNYGETVGFLSNAQFNIENTSTNAYITATTTSTVEGLTVLGDLQVTGTIYPQGIQYPDKVSSIELAYGGSLISLDNIAAAIENYRPKIATVSGTLTVAYRGWYNRLGQGITTTEDDSLSLTASGEYVIPIDRLFTSVGDTLELILTDITNPPNFKTYRITYQYLGGSFTDEKASIIIERLL